MHRAVAWIFVPALVGCALWVGCKSDDDASADETPAAGSSGGPAAGGGATAATGGASGTGTSGAGQGGASSGGAGASGSAGSNAGASGSSASGSGSGGSGSGGSSAGSGAAGSAAGSGGAGSGAAGSAGSTAGSAGSEDPGEEGEPFSFFVTSLEGMIRLSKSEDGFGGDLTYGEADGLTGADKICTELAENSMPGSGAKQWHAFLSANHGPGGGAVSAIDRVGDGPWYDRLGRLVAMTKADLLQTRPRGADSAIADDLPNEFGIPNKQPDPSEPEVDNHHVLTGSNEMGKVYGANATCSDWTSTAQSAGRPRVGFAWPAGGRMHWISGQDEGGCGAGVSLEDMGGSDPGNPIVGSGGGYGAIYCFALTP